MTTRNAGPRLPDFIIGGAPKCGTTSLHFILGQHDDIGIPDQEIHYFDADDPIVHPDFFFQENGELAWFDGRGGEGRNLAWYESWFTDFAARPLVGEDSTTYLLSEVAAPRIKALLPDVRLIFMLRNPVERAYSQYWHLMKTSRATVSFEEAISRCPSILIGSTYASSLKRYFDAFDATRIKVVLFEDFVCNTQQTVDEVTAFLGVRAMALGDRTSWYNRTLYPVSVRGQRLMNRIGAQVVRQRYRNHMHDRKGLSQRVIDKAHYWWFAYPNRLLLRSTTMPPMRSGTRDYLEQHLSARNRGLSALLGRPLGDTWPGFADEA